MLKAEIISNNPMRLVRKVDILDFYVNMCIL
jgi:hypothetical protein